MEGLKERISQSVGEITRTGSPSMSEEEALEKLDLSQVEIVEYRKIKLEEAFKKLKTSGE